MKKIFLLAAMAFALVNVAMAQSSTLEGVFVADEFHVHLKDGRIISGKFSSFERLNLQDEEGLENHPILKQLDRIERFGLLMHGYVAYKFEGDEWRDSFSKEIKFKEGPSQKFKLEGEKLALVHASANSEDVLEYKDGRILKKIANAGGMPGQQAATGSEFTIVFTKK